MLMVGLLLAYSLTLRAEQSRAEHAKSGITVTVQCCHRISVWAKGDIPSLDCTLDTGIVSDTNGASSSTAKQAMQRAEPERDNRLALSS
jgi:hypothetical protein